MAVQTERVKYARHLKTIGYHLFADPYEMSQLDDILQNKRALMETEGMFERRQLLRSPNDLRTYRSVPQEQREKIAEYLGNWFSSDIVTQTLGIPKAEVNAA